MRYMKLGLCSLLLAGWALLVSCVEETPDEFSQAALGYIDYKQDVQQKVLRAVDGFTYHAPEFDADVFPEQSKWMIYCKVEGVDSTALTKEVRFFAEPIRFEDENFARSADTLVVRDNERPIQSLSLTAKLNNFLCVSSLHNDSVGQVNRLEVFYTEKDTLKEFNDCNVYTLYLRSYQVAAATDTVSSQKVTLHTAYDLTAFLKEKEKIEAEKGKTAFYLCLKYITSITRTPKPEEPEQPEEPDEPEQPDQGDTPEEGGNTPAAASVHTKAVEMEVKANVYEPGEEKYILVPITAQ